MEESWRVSASLPLPLVPLRALVGGERVTASSESSSGGYSYRRSALPDLITAGGAHPHIQTPFTQDLNKGNNDILKYIEKRHGFASQPILLHLELLVDVSRGVRDCLRLRMSQHQSLVSEQGLSINIFLFYIFKVSKIGPPKVSILLALLFVSCSLGKFY